MTFNHSTDIEYEEFIDFYKIYTAKPCYILVFDTTLASYNL